MDFDSFLIIDAGLSASSLTAPLRVIRASGLSGVWAAGVLRGGLHVAAGLYVFGQA